MCIMVALWVGQAAHCGSFLLPGRGQRGGGLKELSAKRCYSIRQIGFYAKVIDMGSKFISICISISVTQSSIYPSKNNYSHLIKFCLTQGPRLPR